tara:strand:+ start:662 stop:886 length:225 start_codon:yes stop_codon:yes gene_type:complete
VTSLFGLVSFLNIDIFYGTGSYPPLNNELHFNILLAVKKEPLKTPCFFKAMIPYSEHVGVCLQLPPNKGDIKIL